MKYFRITSKKTSTGEVHYYIEAKRKWYHFWKLQGVYATHKIAAGVLEKLLAQPLN